MKSDDDLIKDVHVLLYPLRYRIVELLEEKPMHVTGISTVLEEERRLVSYHLLILVEHGFLRSNSVIIYYGRVLLKGKRSSFPMPCR
ncbi:MAG: ArsR family transcriptional regulator [Candidatus Syntrophoarchaeum sp.]|nr:ArsR family transcriptional regulator [Candidatus Syntrophoarchaeum sp.]